MARFRHLHAADGNGLDFDWRDKPFGHLPGYVAPLENGDSIEMYGLTNRKGGQPPRWSYHILGPRLPDEDLYDENGDRKPGPWHHHTDGNGGHSQWLGSGGQGHLRRDEESGVAPRNEYTDLRQPTDFDNPHDAMRAAEHHYRALDRRGITPSHTEDYDINDIMRRFDGGEL
jgi:hypothetical protein